MAERKGGPKPAQGQAKPGKSGGGVLGGLVSLVFVLAVIVFVGILIYRFFEDTLHKASFEDGLPWPSLTEVTWLGDCHTASLHETTNTCQGSPQVLWQVRLDAIKGPDAVVVSLARRNGDRFSFDVSLAKPMVWPANTDALIGQRIILGGEVRTDVVFGHEIEDAVLWGFPYRSNLPHSAGVPVDFLISDFWRNCAGADSRAFAASCQGRRLLVDVVQDQRVDNRVDGVIPITVDPRPRVTLALNGRYIWTSYGINDPGTRLRVIGTIEALTRNDEGGVTLTLAPASILTPLR